MNEKHLSDGGACWEFYQEICQVEKRWRASMAEASRLRSMLEAWMLDKYGSDAVKLMQMSPTYPMILPEEAGRVIAEIKEMQNE